MCSGGGSKSSCSEHRDELGNCNPRRHFAGPGRRIHGVERSRLPAGVPLIAGTKRPAVKWSDPATCYQWTTGETTERVGLPTGPRNGFWCLDLDCKRPRRTAWPRSRSVRRGATSRNVHRAHPERRLSLVLRVAARPEDRQPRGHPAGRGRARRWRLRLRRRRLQAAQRAPHCRRARVAPDPGDVAPGQRAGRGERRSDVPRASRLPRSPRSRPGVRAHRARVHQRAGRASPDLEDGAAHHAHVRAPGRRRDGSPRAVQPRVPTTVERRRAAAHAGPRGRGRARADGDVHVVLHGWPATGKSAGPR